MSNKSMDALRRHRAALLKNEENAALCALAKHLHERIEGHFSDDIPSMRIFNSVEDFVRVFGTENPAWSAAAHRVLNDLAKGGYIEGEGENAHLTRRGFAEFTRPESVSFNSNL